MRTFSLFSILTLLIAIIIVILVLTKYKNQYINYNLLRLNPLEESKSALDQLKSSQNKDSVIWLLGDSRISQWNLFYLKTLESPIVNLGIEGQTSKQTLENFKKYLEISHPYCVVIQVGINDFKVIGLLEDKTNEIVSNCYSNTIEILNECKSRNIRAIYIPIIPTGKIEFLRRFIWNSGIDKQIIEFNTRMKAYCSGNNVLYFDFANMMEKIPGAEKKKYQKGFLHLSDSGYRYLSKEFIQFYNSELTNHKFKH